MSRDTIFLLQAMGAGVLIPFLYDWLRIFRKVVPHKQFVVSLEDFFFWVFCAISVFLWMYRVSNGSMRWFAVAGALFSMYLYKAWWSEFFVNILAKLLNRLLGILKKVLYRLTAPVRFFGRKVHTLGQKVGRRRRKFLENRKIWLKSRLKALTIRVTKK